MFTQVHHRQQGIHAVSVRCSDEDTTSQWSQWSACIYIPPAIVGFVEVPARVVDSFKTLKARTQLAGNNFASTQGVSSFSPLMQRLQRPIQ